jgi:hypothetical protein
MAEAHAERKHHLQIIRRGASKSTRRWAIGNIEIPALKRVA